LTIFSFALKLPHVSAKKKEEKKVNKKEQDRKIEPVVVCHVKLRFFYGICDRSTGNPNKKKLFFPAKSRKFKQKKIYLGYF
jgi:hypothetical protein